MNQSPSLCSSDRLWNFVFVKRCKITLLFHHAPDGGLCTVLARRQTARHLPCAGRIWANGPAGCRQDLLQELIADIFPRWTERVTGAMADAPTKADRILAYALAHVDLLAEGAHAVGFALATLAPGLALDSRWT